MPNCSVFDSKGNKVSDIALADSIFGIEPNVSAMHLCVVNYLANQRQGTQSTKTRSEVSGGGKKPWRQKGTGRARQGSTRAPQWTHGGIAHGPKPREYGFSINKKVRKLAMRSALSSKVASEKMIVIENMDLAEVKTAAVAKALKAIGASDSSLIVLEGVNKNAELSARNIKDVKTALVNTINVMDILKYDSFVATKAAVEKIEEVYK